LIRQEYTLFGGREEAPEKIIIREPGRLGTGEKVPELVRKKIAELGPGEDGLNVRGRILEAGDPRVVETRGGLRTLSEAVIGDETGRVKLTLWGNHAGTVKAGETVEVQNAFTTVYRGRVQLNVGSRGSIVRIADEEVVKEEEIPEVYPEAPTGWDRARRRYGRRGF